MAQMSFGERHIITGIDPVADAFSGTVYTDVVNMSGYAFAEFLIHKGVGATGTSTVTIEACDNASGDNPVAVPFAYQEYISTTTDLPGAVKKATTTGFALTAGSSQLYVAQVDSQVMGGKGWVRAKLVEVVDSPVLAGVIIRLGSPRYGTDIPPTAIA